MPNDPESSNYLVARFFIGLFLLVAIVFFAAAAWYLYEGVSHWRGSTRIKAEDPFGFWLDIAFHGAFVVGACWFAYSMRDAARRK